MSRQRLYPSSAERQRAYRQRKRNTQAASIVTLPAPYYQDAAVTLYCGDCLAILPLLPEGAIDLVLTDPPYNVGLGYRSINDHRSDYADWCRQWFTLCPRPLVFTPGTINLWLWGEIERPTWTCAWYKPNQNSPNGIGGFNRWEPVLVYGRPRKRVGEDAWNHLVSFREQRNGAGQHPCIKPLGFWKRLLASFSEPGDVVLDIFAGSGTTGLAAKVLGRRAILIERDEHYCALAAQRLSQQVMDFEEAA